MYAVPVPSCGLEPSAPPRGPAVPMLRHLAMTAVAVVVALATLTATAVAAVAETGIDVSRWQHGSSLDWSAVQGDGVSFAFIKATEGRTYTNPYFAEDWAATGALGMHHGAYHFARPSVGSAGAQARYFVSQAGLFDQPGDLPPVLDLEATGGLTVAQLRTWTSNWLGTVQELTGRVPMIYCSPYFWETHLGNSPAFAGYPLWIANYGVSQPRVPGGWSDWTFWQTTSSGRVSGISGNVDMNTFNGTLAQLDALAGGPPAPQPSTPQPPAPPAEPPAEPPAPVGSTTITSLTPSSEAVFAGQSVTLSGTVTTTEGAPVPGVSVTVSRQDSADVEWGGMATVTTDAAGRFTTPARIDAASSFQASFAGDTTYDGSLSPSQTVTLRPRIGARVDLHSTRSRVRRGRSIKLYGHLTTATSAALPDRRVRVYQRKPGATRWTRVATGRSLAPTGWWQVVVRPRRTMVYKAVFAGTTQVTPATSNRIRVRLRR